MEDMEALGRELFAGKNGEALRSLAQNGEVRRLGKRLDRAAAAEALRSGDEEKIKSLLESILSSADGQALAQALSALDKTP